MKFFAQLRNNIVIKIINTPDYSIFSEDYIDITNIDPKPKRGYLYNPNTGEFSAPVQEVPKVFYIHSTITGGDGKNPIGIRNDGVHSITATLTFKDVSGNIIPINDDFRTVIRSEDGSIYDVILINFVNGVAELQYSTTNSPNKCSIWEKDFTTIPVGPDTYSIKLASPISFVVFRSTV